MKLKATADLSVIFKIFKFYAFQVFHDPYEPLIFIFGELFIMLYC